MRYLFYTTSASAWDGLYEAIQTAKNSIYMEMYIFIDDTPRAHDLIELLTKKASEGVAVRIVLDGFGSFGLSGKAQKKMREAGVEIHFFRRLFRRLHRKIVIVDETIGFFGGVNIHKSALLWNDLLVRAEGEIVKSLIRSFRRIYKSCGGRDPYILAYRHKAVLGRTRVWLLEHVPFMRRPRLRDAYTESIHKATKRIILVTPYFTPSTWLIRLLVRAARHGVMIEVVLPKTPDVSLFTRANLRYINMLSPEGIAFYQTTAMTHAKLLLIDETLALVGSQNIDALSFDFNAELGVFFTQPSVIKRLHTIVDVWKKDSVQFTAPPKVTFYDRFASIVVKMIQPFL